MRRNRGVASGESASYREKAKQDYNGRCDRCGEETPWEAVEVHHVDRLRSNDNRDNLENLCHECHRVEHHGDDPLWGVVVSMPRAVLELVDEAVERNGYHSRSEAVARAVVDSYGDGGLGSARESVICWFSDGAHTKWVSDSVVEPPKGGRQR